MSSSAISQPSLDFPYLLAPQRSLMTSLLATVETHLAPLLPPTRRPTLPRPLWCLQRAPSTSDPAKRTLRLFCYWVHCDLPTGTSLDIATAFAFLGPATDAPHRLVKLIQSSPTSLILLMDLLPRQDLVLHPDCLKAFYEDTHLEKQRQKLVTIPETDLFFSSNLYIRGVLSPTAILVTIDCASGEVARSMDEIVRDVVDQVVKDVVRTWSDADHGGGGELVVIDGLRKKKERWRSIWRQTCQGCGRGGCRGGGG